MSPVLAHGCPDTPLLALPCRPRVRVGLYTPRGSSRRGAPSHVPVEAPCSALADDTAEERLCPYTYGSAMLRAGDKQLRVAHGRINLREPRAQCLASSQRLPLGAPREGAGHGGCARVTPERTPPSQVHRTLSSCAPPRAEPRYKDSFERQGGLLSIATQDPNWSRSPSLLSSERLMAVEVCTGPGPADVERQILSSVPSLFVVRTSRGTPEHHDSGA